MMDFSEYLEKLNIKKFTIDELVILIKDYATKLKEVCDKEVDNYLLENNLYYYCTIDFKGTTFKDIIYDAINGLFLFQDSKELIEIVKNEKKKNKRRKKYVQKEIDYLAFFEVKAELKGDRNYYIDELLDRKYDLLDSLKDSFRETKEKIIFLKKVKNAAKKNINAFESIVGSDDYYKYLSDIYSIHVKYFEKLERMLSLEVLRKDERSIVREKLQLKLKKYINYKIGYYNDNKNKNILAFDLALVDFEKIDKLFYLNIYMNNFRKVTVENLFDKYSFRYNSYNDNFLYIKSDNMLKDKLDISKIIEEEINTYNLLDKNRNDYKFNYDYNTVEWSSSKEYKFIVKDFIDKYYNELNKLQNLYRKEVNCNIDFVKRDLFDIFENLSNNQNNSYVKDIRVISLEDVYNRKFDYGIENIDNILEIKNLVFYEISVDGNDIILTVDKDKEDVYYLFEKEDNNIEFILNNNKDRIIDDYIKTINLEEKDKLDIVRNIKYKYLQYLDLCSFLLLDNGMKLKFGVDEISKLGNLCFEENNMPSMIIEVYDRNGKLVDRNNSKDINDELLYYGVEEEKLDNFYLNCKSINLKERDLSFEDEFLDKNSDFVKEYYKKKKLLKKKET